MAKLSLEYIAGIIDGDGYIGIYQPRRYSNSFYVKIVVAMTDPQVPNCLKVQFGGCLWKSKIRDNWKETTSWSLNGKQVEPFLRSILPFLVVKKEQAKLALALRDHSNTRKRYRKGHQGLIPLPEADRKLREDMKNKMHQLNQRGVIAYA